ncbi:MAG TPA: phosphoesterase [Methanocorpusculum sp.]|nr:phosphoesterase [Methanocorpusculum sp.]
MAFRFRKQKSSAPTVQDKLRDYQGTIVHLTHNDLDAAGSDAIVRMNYGNEILTFFSSVGKFDWFLGQIGNYNGAHKTLIISDLGYQKDIEDKVRKVRAAGWTIQWYDHHKWTAEEESMIRDMVSTLTVDTSRCATGVLAAALKPEQPYAEEVARVVCDYDLWKHEDKRSGMLGIVTSGSANLKFIRDKLYQGIIIDDEVTAIYTRIEAEKNACIRKSIRRASVTTGKYRVAVMPCYGYPSETAAETRRQLNTDIELLVFDNGKFSLRSVPAISHLIAREFNGGGHPNASGGSFPYACKERFLFKVFHKVSGKETFLAVTEKY